MKAPCRIIIPTDFSDNAWNAIRYAVNLYANEYCTFYLLHAMKIKSLTISNFSNRLLQTIRNTVAEEMTSLKQKIECNNINTNHSFEIIISDYAINSALETAVKKQDIQLIIMGTKGASKTKKLFYGSTTASIIKQSKLCPILIIPDGFHFTIPKRIALLTNLDYFYQKQKLTPLKKIAGLYQSEINTVYLNNQKYLNQSQSYNADMLENELSNFNYHFYWISNYGKKTKDINRFVASQKINMLVMIHYRYRFIEAIIKEAVINNIAYQPQIPFLVIPE